MINWVLNSFQSEQHLKIININITMWCINSSVFICRDNLKIPGRKNRRGYAFHFLVWGVKAKLVLKAKSLRVI